LTLCGEHRCSSSEPRYRHSCLVTIVFTALFGGLLFVGLLWMFRVHSDIVRDSYCLDAVAMMLERTLDATNGEWPTKWGDLFDHYDSVDAITGDSWSTTEIRERVWVNFAYRRGEPSEHAFGLRSGRDVHWGDESPVKRVVRRFNSKDASIPRPRPLDP